MAIDSEQDFDLRHIAGVLRQRAWIVVLLVIVTVGTTYFATTLAPRIYQATAQIQLVNPNSDNVFQNGASVAVDPKRLVETQTGVIQSASLRAVVDQELGSRAAQIEGLAVTNEAGTDLINISVTSQDPEVARDAANTFANMYLERRRAEAVKDLDQRASELRNKATDLATQIAQLDQQIRDSRNGDPALSNQRNNLAEQQADFSNRASEFEVESSLRSGSALVVDPAALPMTPISPKPLRDMALAAAAALIVGIGLVLLLDRVNDKVNTPEDLDAITRGVPLFGAVPIYAPNKRRGRSKLPHDERSLVPLSSPDAEAYRTVRTNLRFSNLAKAKRVVMVTSPSGGEGKSTITANLAVSLAENGQRVVVVSADLRRPTLSGIFGAHETDRGLTTVLVGDDTVVDALVPYALDSGHRMYLLPAGPLPSNPAELLGSRAMGDLLASLTRADVDFVLVDCPPVLPVSDPLGIAQFVDGVIVVSVVGQTKSRNLRESIQRLEQVGADVIGVVLNGVPTRGGSRYAYQYSHRYGDDNYQSPPPATNASGRRGNDRRERAPSSDDGRLDPAPAPLATDPGRPQRPERATSEATS